MDLTKQDKELLIRFLNREYISLPDLNYMVTLGLLERVTGGFKLKDSVKVYLDE